MNRIFEKSRPKRKYHKKPSCANLEGVCDYKVCRCGYSNILDKRAKNSIRKGIDEDLPHRQRVIKRRKEIDMMKLDLENAIDEHLEREAPRHFKGYIPEKKIPKHLLRNSILIFITFPIIYIVVVLILDLIK